MGEAGGAGRQAVALLQLLVGEHVVTTADAALLLHTKIHGHSSIVVESRTPRLASGRRSSGMPVSAAVIAAVVPSPMIVNLCEVVVSPKRTPEQER